MSVRFAIRSLLTLGREPQNFLGAWWIPALVRRSPRMALRMLSLSPHYFYGENGELWLSRKQLQAEHQRNREQRRKLIQDVVLPHVQREHMVIDYGCGPGYLAVEAARYVKRVVACDISDGVLACARVINGAPNIEYVTAVSDGIEADLAYSFAVAQHVRDSALQEILKTLHGAMKPGAVLLMHFPIDAEGWRTESDWLNDKSLAGRGKMKYALNCFTRSQEQVIGLAEQAGFSHCQLARMRDFTDLANDVTEQSLLIART